MRWRGRSLASGVAVGVALGLSTFGCGSHDAASSASDSSAALPSGAPSLAASPSGSPSNPTGDAKGALTGLVAKKLARKATPASLAAADQTACDDKKADGCRRVADRYRGYGASAGCGIDRKRPAPFVKRIVDDADIDERGYTVAIRQACSLGDSEACALATTLPQSFSLRSESARRIAVRSHPDDLGIWAFQAKLKPAQIPGFVKAREQCLTTPTAGWCTGYGVYHLDKPKPGDKNAPDLAAVAIEVCKSTHDCPELMMFLDQKGMTPEALAPVRKAFAETLTESCLSGECTCGDAARYVESDDASGMDLALFGCENGEAEGCYELARRIEDGRGVEKDPARALGLYQLACPPIAPQDFNGNAPPMGEYSPRACDRLAEIAAEGTLPPKNWTRAMFYANRACVDHGVAVDQAPCVRLGRFYATSVFTGHNGMDARSAAWGSDDGPECKRPSVKDACAELDKDLAKLR